MHVVIGNSIKIETTVDVETADFISNYLNQSKLTEMIFYNHDNMNTSCPVKFNLEKSVDNNTLILQNDDINIETHVNHSSNQKTKLLILVDVYNDHYSLNDIINNVITFTESISNDLSHN